MLRLNPELPPELTRLDMRIRYRGHTLDLHLTPQVLTVRSRERGAAPIRLLNWIASNCWHGARREQACRSVAARRYVMTWIAKRR